MPRTAMKKLVEETVLAATTALNEDGIGSANNIIEISEPYTAFLTVRGVADLLWHAWDCDAIEEKANARKGSKAKKSDDLESYVYRDEDGIICIPGTYLRGALVTAARFKQDPRSPRKNAQDLIKAGVIPVTLMAPLGTDIVNKAKTWDYEHRGRVTVQRNGVTRTRPAFKAGWQATFEVEVLLPEYISRDYLHELAIMAGRFAGFGDYRPTFGRFNVTKFSIK